MDSLEGVEPVAGAIIELIFMADSCAMTAVVTGRRLAEVRVEGLSLLTWSLWDSSRFYTVTHLQSRVACSRLAVASW